MQSKSKCCRVVWEQFQVTEKYLQLVLIEFSIILDDVGLMMMIKKFQILNQNCLLHIPARSSNIILFFFTTIIGF